MDQRQDLLRGMPVCRECDELCRTESRASLKGRKQLSGGEWSESHGKSEV